MVAQCQPIESLQVQDPIDFPSYLTERQLERILTGFQITHVMYHDLLPLTLNVMGRQPELLHH